MELIISSPQLYTVTLTLKRGRAVIDTVDFSFDKNLDSLLIVSIDKFLKRNRIDILSLKSVSVAKNVDRISSLYKVVRTFSEAFKAIKKASNS